MLEYLAYILIFSLAIRRTQGTRGGNILDAILPAPEGPRRDRENPQVERTLYIFKDEPLNRRPSFEPFLGRSLRGVFLELLDISLLDLAHQIATVKDIRAQVD